MRKTLLILDIKDPDPDIKENASNENYFNIRVDVRYLYHQWPLNFCKWFLKNMLKIFIRTYPTLITVEKL